MDNLMLSLTAGEVGLIEALLIQYRNDAKARADGGATIWASHAEAVGLLITKIADQVRVADRGEKVASAWIAAKVDAIVEEARAKRRGEEPPADAYWMDDLSGNGPEA